MVAKRIFDVVGAAVIAIALAPVFAAVYIAIRMYLGSPVLFRQQRAGLHGRPFTLVKFRTMTDARDDEGNLLPDSERLTRLGRFLRRTSLDELPELWNVIVGDMSLVGPRPLLVEYLPLYRQDQARRHDVRPGITGWAQVNGRNSLSWEERFALDVWYIDNQSLLLDIKILIRTVLTVLSAKGISQEGHATMPRFDSSAK